MRQITYWKDLKLSGLASFNVIEKRVVKEESLFDGWFDKIVEHVQLLGCSYEIVELQEPVVLQSNTGIASEPLYDTVSRLWEKMNSDERHNFLKKIKE